jgi:PAS domain S-box-containing protein
MHLDDEDQKSFAFGGKDGGLSHLDLAKELKKKDLLLQYLFDNAPLGIMQTLPGGVIVRANRMAHGIFGYSYGEMNGKFVDDLVLPDDKRLSGEEYTRKLHSEKEVVVFEDVRRRKDGSLFYASFIGFPVLMDGEVVGVFAIYQDITKRKEAEQVLKEKVAYAETEMRTMKRYWEQTISLVSSVVEARDPYTAGHQQNVAVISREIGRKLGLSGEEIYPIYVAAMVHDIGKVEIPSEILAKPGKLTSLERELVKRHPEAGKRILSKLETPWPIAEIVYQHHERINGGGYPRGLKKNDILLAARIIAVADVVDAMETHRPYRPALGKDAVLEELYNGKGVLYDEDVVDAWMCLTGH